eukprot:3372609-Prymnesium_polylepis.1
MELLFHCALLVSSSLNQPAPGLELVAFTLLRGGPSASDYEMFANSRLCLADAIPSIVYDDVAFHEGNVPPEMQRALRQKM